LEEPKLAFGGEFLSKAVRGKKSGECFLLKVGAGDQIRNNAGDPKKGRLLKKDSAAVPLGMETPRIGR